MPYTLMVSHDCGWSYHVDQKAEAIEDLLDRMKALDDESLRWYVDDPIGEQCHDMPCAIHAKILGLLR